MSYVIRDGLRLFICGICLAGECRQCVNNVVRATAPEMVICECDHDIPMWSNTKMDETMPMSTVGDIGSFIP